MKCRPQGRAGSGPLPRDPGGGQGARQD